MEKVFQPYDSTVEIADEVEEKGKAVIGGDTTSARRKCREVLEELNRRGVDVLTVDKANNKKEYMSHVYREDAYEA